MTPANETELAEAVKSASGPLAIRGGGTRIVGRASDAQVLSVSEMSAITLYEPGALTLVAEAGTPLEEIETALAAENQMLAFEPMDHRPLLGTEGRPTIGGVVAANVSGPRRVQAGA
ncbi:MAG: FAD-binding protein, partial [Silicimonas sp.]|nr:FAD-binding protein [Silicimonas sp.]